MVPVLSHAQASLSLLVAFVNRLETSTQSIYRLTSSDQSDGTKKLFQGPISYTTKSLVNHATTTRYSV
jgi:hypothetical protein